MKNHTQNVGKNQARTVEPLTFGGGDSAGDGGPQPIS